LASKWTELRWCPRGRGPAAGVHVVAVQPLAPWRSSSSTRPPVGADVAVSSTSVNSSRSSSAAAAAAAAAAAGGRSRCRVMTSFPVPARPPRGCRGSRAVDVDV